MRTVNPGVPHNRTVRGGQAILRKDAIGERAPNVLKGGTVECLLDELSDRTASLLGPTSQGLAAETAGKYSAVEGVEAHPRLAAQWPAARRPGPVMGREISPIQID